METKSILNGVDLKTVGETVEAIRQDPELAKSKFHVTNQWINGGHNRATVRDFYGAKQEIQHNAVFEMDEDEPALLAGTDVGPNPVEYLLTALSGCMTSAMVYHAALRGIQINSLECTVEGDIDLQGFLGISNDVRKGYSDIRVTFKVDANEENLQRLKSLSKLSPVYDTILNGTNIDVSVESK
jgi:uncharacterized OsmC-like protein